MKIYQVTFTHLVNFIGIVAVFRIIFRFVTFVYIYIRPSSILRYKTEGAYAVVTGASDGIGKGIALELAAKGFNLILHAKDSVKMNTVISDALMINPSLDIRCVIHDSSVYGIPDISGIEHLPIKILVNNVGIGPIKAFSQLSAAEIDAIVNVNILFATQLTNRLLPFLSGDSLILNISSYAGILPPPFLAVYAATKAYNNAFSKSLSIELENIETISILTGSVHTGSNKKPVSFLRPSSQHFAKKVLSVVGCGKKSVMPYWPHAAQTYLLSLLPERMMDNAMKNSMQKEVSNR
ncbi:SDR family NAD(P)-dependent oxidoreductase [Dyadobacter subterraneus]|uniref:SDR family NAD(P)-dependent oxidoreductase n=1 Tax=Dyadobacter subterraneus TaxID=2773304 RepID=A0ABR9WET8_9BACT|nr:SDR family NAD(P)-dependent oxidoreductase [Dyadobacter subterraneus]MBE9464017.1 SDR family NAD(P)-dependent oxidoreductase [Dyadobacter subterraneus]